MSIGKKSKKLYGSGQIAFPVLTNVLQLDDKYTERMLGLVPTCAINLYIQLSRYTET